MGTFALLASSAPAGLPDVVKTAVQGALSSLQASGIEIIGMVIVAAMAVTVAGVGARYALKMVKGALSKA